jgi:hypothetical protein
MTYDLFVEMTDAAEFKKQNLKRTFR